MRVRYARRTMHPRSSIRGSALFTIAAVALGGAIACGKSTEQIGTLRVETVEIVDDKGATKVNVGERMKQLEQRVKTLEAALDKLQAEKHTVPTTTVQATAAAIPLPVPAAPSGRPASPVATGKPNKLDQLGF